MLNGQFAKMPGADGKEKDLMYETGIPVSRWIDGVLEDAENIDQPNKVRPMVFWGCGTVALAAFLALPKPFDNYLHNGLLMPLLVLVLLNTMVSRHGNQDGLDADWLRHQGVSSFSLYIIHLPFANYLNLVLIPLIGNHRFTLSFMVVDIALLMALAPWVERRFETPWRERLRAWAHQRFGASV